MLRLKQKRCTEDGGYNEQESLMPVRVIGLTWLAHPIEKALFNARLNYFKQTGILQIGTGFVIGKITALPRSGRMNRAALAEPIIGEQEA
jgi:hypothetical protein